MNKTKESKKGKGNDWIHSFAITDINRHPKGYTVYKITSIIIPKNVPEALSIVTVQRRFKEIKVLHKEILQKAKQSGIPTAGMPEFKNSYFKRFHPAIIEERKEFILRFLDFIGNYPALFRSESFVKFFSNEKPAVTDAMDEDETVSMDLELEVNRQAECSNAVMNLIGERMQPSSGDSEANDLLEQLQQEAELDENLERSKNQEIEERLRRLQEHTPSDYLYKAALNFTEAVEAEASGKYKEAFEAYKAGIDKLLGGAKTDVDEDRKKIAKETVAKYLARAEDIYENFVLKQATDDFVFVDAEQTRKSFEERPLNYLSRFKVLKILDNGLQQVQDVTDKKVYILKVVPKLPSLKASDPICLPRHSSLMVPLVTYCQSSDAIFLLLKPVSSGRLWAYIQSYAAKPSTEPSSLKSLFVEPKSPRQPPPKKPPKTEIPVYAADDFRASSPASSQLSSSPPSVNMEVTSLMQHSQRLLNSVAATLDRTKEEEEDVESIDEGSIEEILREISKDGDQMEPRRSSIQSILQDMQDDISSEIEKPSSVETHSTLFDAAPVPKLLSEATVVRYCDELVTAVLDLHANGIVCGDLSLDNLLLGPNGQLVLTYFYSNEAKLRNPSRTSEELGYVAPERPLTSRSDWWSVGVIMFELITERRFHKCHPGGVGQFVELQFPRDVEVSEQAKDILSNLIVPEVEARFDGPKILSHPFIQHSKSIRSQ